MGVQRGVPDRRVLLRAGQGLELGAGGGVLGAVLVEDGRDGAEPGPAGQDLLLGGRGRPAACLDAAQRRQRVQVGADPGDGAGRGQIVLPGGPEPG
ncbi:MAG: hypothetical protein ACRDOL_25600 [Streptosporangiaceae bacterium]